MSTRRRGLPAPLLALRRSVADPALARVGIAFAAVMMASWTLTVSLTVVAFEAAGSPGVAAAVLARTVPVLALAPAAGAVVDRLSRRTLRSAVAAAGALASAGAAVAGSALVPAVLLVAVVALATTTFRAATNAAVPELVEETADLTAANVMLSAVEQAGAAAGPALAALLLGLQGPTAASGAAAVLFAVGAVVSLGLGADRRRPARTRPARGARSSPGTRRLARIGAVRLVLLLVVVQTLVAGGLGVLYPALAVDSLDVGLSAVGVLSAAVGLGGVLGSLGLFALAGSRRLGLLTAAALLLWSAPLLLVPVVPELAPVLVLLTVVGVGNVFFDVTAVTLLQRAVPPPLLGRTFGVLESVVVAGAALGAVIAPLLERAAGPAGAVALLGAALGLTTLVGLPLLLRLDRRLPAPAREVELLRGLPPFALLPPVELEGLALLMTRDEVAAGEAVVRQGETDTRYLVLDEGELDVLVDGRTVGVLASGDGFGEVALLRGGVRTATVTARTAALVRVLERDVFLAALRSDGGASLEAAEAVAQERLDRAAPAA